MMEHFTQLYPFGRLRYSQSTFPELVTDTEVHRINFRGKRSFRLQRGSCGAVSFHQEHPLLGNAQGPLTTLLARATRHYLTAPAALLAAIRQELQTQAGEWYDFPAAAHTMWWKRLHAHNIRTDLPRTGGLILSGVPIPVAQAVADICAHYGVETYGHEPPIRISATPPDRLLLIGRSHVIAREFFVSTLCGGALGKRTRVRRGPQKLSSSGME
ncbi:hypothetical protein [Hymenobacter cellulosilyticus]|uniref:Uncharacterized protein n=1 Tax=Hymenobacter cellulosilyticus TaxID=2932248 RepID=A0A8T9Q2A4_9BACT|nr:hypothetical protein [Hymenobacter cellulosilyticus]UOQ71062.1 hypothetical protein MUN79_20670 [Hymenobacter cellulosilyticus]